MTDRSKFEQMLEHLINEDQEKAKELFHQLVVEKSREIYENILAEDFDSVEEAKEEEADDEEQVEENFGFATEADDEEGEDGDIGGDAGDDFIDDVDAEGGDEEGEGEEGGEDLEDRVVDLEDALDDLRAEFEQLMADESGEEEHGDMDFGGDMGPDMGGEDELEDSFDGNFMREYVEKVSAPKGGDNGANTKSAVAGKNDMGGTTANIAKGGEAKGEGTKGGLLNPSTKEDNAGNINVPGGKAGSAFSKKEPGHGAEKKGTGESADNKKSVVGGK